MTFLLTVSPKEAVELLNGNLADLIRSWKVPLGTAYIAVKKEKPYVSEWHREEPPRFFIPTKEILWIDKIFGGVNYLNGLVVAKCEITACEPTKNRVLQMLVRRNADKSDYHDITFTSLSVLDKPMEVGQFKGNGIAGRYDTGVKIYGWKPITKLPSRWQEVEVGE